jgi:hypothetical protein
MPTIEITEEQLERLEAVRAEVEEALAGPYGTVPTSGAVEYLLDTYTPPDKSGVDAGGATEAASVEDRPQERNDGGLAAIDPIGSAKAAALERSGYKSVDDLKTASIADLTEVEGIGETLAARILEAVSSDDAGGEPDETNADGNPGDATSGTRTVVSGGTPTPGNDGAGTTRLNAMMNLLDQHADKWNESGGDEPYEVELPDGSTETARTKDDVRGLLFRHYG